MTHFMLSAALGAEAKVLSFGGGEKCSEGALIINILSHNKKKIVEVNAAFNMIGHITQNASINSTV